MFSFSKLTKLSSSIGAIGGVIAYYCIEKNNGTVFASWTTGYVPTGPKWDRNWDMRDPEVQRDPKSGDGDKKEKIKPIAVRHIILIRHGQYNLGGRTDEQCSLTELGRKQAAMTGERLKDLNLPYARLISSTMTRAKETSQIISNFLPHVPIETSPLLEEGAPIPPEPPIGHWKPPHYQFHQDGARIEAAYRRYFYRADVDQEKDSYEIIVCHANVIRYFVCRALQYPPEGWLRLSLRHASITWLSIMPSGRVTLKCYSDAGYMPPDALTTS